MIGHQFDSCTIDQALWNCSGPTTVVLNTSIKLNLSQEQFLAPGTKSSRVTTCLQYVEGIAHVKTSTAQCADVIWCHSSQSACFHVYSDLWSNGHDWPNKLIDSLS